VWPIGPTNVVTDYLGSIAPGPTPFLLYWNRYGDNSDFIKIGPGGPVYDPIFALSVVNRGSVKFIATDVDPHSEGVGGPVYDPIFAYSIVNRGTVKFIAVDVDPHSEGVGGGVEGLTVSNSRYSIFL